MKHRTLVPRTVVFCWCLWIVLTAVPPEYLTTRVTAQTIGKPGNAQLVYVEHPLEPDSTVNNIPIIFAKDGTQTQIMLRICADSPNFQMRSESVGNWTTEVFHRTQKANGCSPSTSLYYIMVYGIPNGSTATYRIYATANDGVLSEAAFMQRAARTDCRVTGHGTGVCTPAQPAQISVPVASIDMPSNGQIIHDTITVGGWAIDSGSLNGTGVNEVHVRVNGTFIGAASYGQPRTDVAGSYGDARYGNSGYQLNVDTKQFANGPATIQVSYRSVISGAWQAMERQVVINNGPPDANHTDTKLRAGIENGKTTIGLQVCGRGQNYRFRSVWLNNNNQQLFDQAYGVLDGCSPEYRAVVNANPGDTFRFYSSVSNGDLSDADFVQRRRDSCRVMAAGVIQCLVGDQLPTPPPASPIPQPAPQPTPACAVSFFSQVDPAWKNHPLRQCSTIGAVGCALTSTAMVFRYYGVDTNPPKLSDCMGNYACPMYWGVGPARCGSGKVTKAISVKATWQALEKEVNQRRRPVVLGLLAPCGKGECSHYVVVLSGSGDNPANYMIHDPGGIYGANVRLSTLVNPKRKWRLNHMVIYSGSQPAGCLNTLSTEADLEVQNAERLAHLGSTVEPLPSAVGDDWALSTNSHLSSVTSSAVVIRLEDESTLILELTSQSEAGAITEMQISSDSAPNEVWQPFTPYVLATANNVVTVRFKDAAGNISEPVKAFATPEQAEVLGYGPFDVYLPLAIR